MKYHRPWQPRIPAYTLFNPFLPVTTRHPMMIERVEVDENEEDVPATSTAEEGDGDTAVAKK